MPNHALSLSLHPDSPAPGLPLRIDVERHDLVALGEQDGVRQPDIPKASHRDLHQAMIGRAL